MFYFVPFLNLSGLAIVAEVDLRSGDFLSKKSCLYKLVVSTSFWSWLLNVLTTKKYSGSFFWVVNVLMRCGYADCSWDFWVLDFGIYVSEICLFLCSFLMRSFVVQIFSFFRTLCG